MIGRVGLTGILAALALYGVMACSDPAPSPFCGDGVVDDGEACDDGNLAYTDDCLPGCLVATCGDHVPRLEPSDPAHREDCDGGGEDSPHCNADCTAALCGDGHWNQPAGEVCDDGNTRSDDGCRADCRSQEVCGNGILDNHLAFGPVNNPACQTADQQNTGCAEVCDDGNTVSGDGCSANCLSDETCGNEITDRASGEACDDGDLDPVDECPNNCMADGDGGLCGDGIVGPFQDCDPGGGQDTPVCDMQAAFPSQQRCTFAVCGDGYRNTAAGEACDDGNRRLDDNCPACRVAVCGDSATDRQLPGLEDCDLGALNGQPGSPCSAACTVVP